MSARSRANRASCRGSAAASTNVAPGARRGSARGFAIGVRSPSEPTRYRCGAPMGSLLLLLLIPLAMWFLVLRPQQARLRAQRDLVATLEAGDRVVTAGGIVGTLTVVGDTEVTLVTTPGVELRVLRGAISRRVDPPAAPGG